MKEKGKEECAESILVDTMLMNLQFSTAVRKILIKNMGEVSIKVQHR